MNRFLLLLIPALFLSACTSGAGNTARDTSAADAAQQTQAATAQLHPAQSLVADDVRITENLRQLLLADPGVSVNGRNIMIYTANGNIILRGAVDDQMEKDSIAMKASGIRGVKSVTNQLEPQAKNLASDDSTVQ